MEERPENQRIAAQNQLIIHQLAKESYRCFMKCVKPSGSLASTTIACLENCIDRKQDIQDFILERYRAKYEKESEKAGMTIG